MICWKLSFLRWIPSVSLSKSVGLSWSLQLYSKSWSQVKWVPPFFLLQNGFSLINFIPGYFHPSPVCLLLYSREESSCRSSSFSCCSSCTCCWFCSSLSSNHCSRGPLTADIWLHRFLVNTSTETKHKSIAATIGAICFHFYLCLARSWKDTFYLGKYIYLEVIDLRTS